MTSMDRNPTPPWKIAQFSSHSALHATLVHSADWQPAETFPAKAVSRNNDTNTYSLAAVVSAHNSPKTSTHNTSGRANRFRIRDSNSKVVNNQLPRATCDISTAEEHFLSQSCKNVLSLSYMVSFYDGQIHYLEISELWSAMFPL